MILSRSRGLKVVLWPAQSAFMDDLSWIIADLAQEKRTSGKTNIEQMILTFLFGVDQKLPIRFDVLVGGVQQGGRKIPPAWRFQPSIPVERGGKDVRTFIKAELWNRSALMPGRRSRGGYYQLQNVYEGWMRMVDEYACIGTYESDVPKGMPNPQGVAR